MEGFYGCLEALVSGGGAARTRHSLVMPLPENQQHALLQPLKAVCTALPWLNCAKIIIFIKKTFLPSTNNFKEGIDAEAHDVL